MRLINSDWGSNYEPIYLLFCIRFIFKLLVLTPDGGTEIDIVIETNGKLYHIEVKSKTSLSGFNISGLKVFKET